MSNIQGYSIAFRPKSKSPSDGYGSRRFDAVSDALIQLSDRALDFMPDGVRARDGAKWEELDHDGGMRKIQALLAAVTDRDPFRVICAPSQELKSRQHDILRELQRIPVHRNAHGFVRGHDALSCANAHLNYWGPQPKGLVLLNADIEGFFYSISRDLVSTALQKHGVPEDGMSAIMDACMLRASPELAVESIRQLGMAVGFNKTSLRNIITTISSSFFWDNDIMRRHLHLILQSILGIGTSIGPGGWFLPQGAPTSPALSNLVFKIIDIRLTAMAKAFGAFYTRYADDLTFSWVAFTKGKSIDGLKRCSEEVIKEYGMHFNPRKVRTVGPGGAQDIVGYVINSGKPTISQKFRRRMRDEIQREKKSKVPTRVEVINRLTGQAGYIQPLHGKEAIWLKEEIVKLNYKSNRALRSENTDHHDIEQPTTTTVRKISHLSE